MKRVLIIAGIAGVLALGIAVGALGVAVGGAGVISTAFAQGPAQNQNGVACHDNTAVLNLLKMSSADLLKERQAGKSLADIAKAKEVTENQLLDALVAPMLVMHAQMPNQANVAAMNQAMRDYFAKDIKETKFGTMTDYRLGLGGNGRGMMGGWNGSNMMGGQQGGMMNGWNGSNMMNGWQGGMMNGWNGSGMMNGWNGSNMMGGNGMMGGRR